VRRSKRRSALRWRGWAAGDRAGHRYVSALFLVYSILILLNILIGWIPRIPFYSRWFRAVLDFITETTDPYLNVFRRLVPSLGGGGMAFSFAPVIALIVLFVVEAVVVGLIRG
jgi:YggT family protein